MRDLDKVFPSYPYGFETTDFNDSKNPYIESLKASGYVLKANQAIEEKAPIFLDFERHDLFLNEVNSYRFYSLRDNIEINKNNLDQHITPDNKITVEEFDALLDLFCKDSKFNKDKLKKEYSQFIPSLFQQILSQYLLKQYGKIYKIFSDCKVTLFFQEQKLFAFAHWSNNRVELIDDIIQHFPGNATALIEFTDQGFKFKEFHTSNSLLCSTFMGEEKDFFDPTVQKQALFEEPDDSIHHLYHQVIEKIFSGEKLNQEDYKDIERIKSEILSFYFLHDKELNMSRIRDKGTPINDLLILAISDENCAQQIFENKEARRRLQYFFVWNNQWDELTKNNNIDLSNDQHKALIDHIISERYLFFSNDLKQKKKPERKKVYQILEVLSDKQLKDLVSQDNFFDLCIEDEVTNHRLLLALFEKAFSHIIEEKTYSSVVEYDYSFFNKLLNHGNQTIRNAAFNFLDENHNLLIFDDPAFRSKSFNEFINAVLKQPQRTCAQHLIERLYLIRKNKYTNQPEEKESQLIKLDKNKNLANILKIFGNKELIKNKWTRADAISFIDNFKRPTGNVYFPHNQLVLNYAIKTLSINELDTIMANSPWLITENLSINESVEIAKRSPDLAGKILPHYSKKSGKNKFTMAQEASIIAAQPSLLTSYYKKPTWFRRTWLGRWLFGKSPRDNLSGETLAHAIIEKNRNTHNKGNEIIRIITNDATLCNRLSNIHEDLHNQISSTSSENDQDLLYTSIKKQRFNSSHSKNIKTPTLETSNKNFDETVKALFQQKKEKREAEAKQEIDNIRAEALALKQELQNLRADISEQKRIEAFAKEQDQLLSSESMRKEYLEDFYNPQHFIDHSKSLLEQFVENQTPELLLQLVLEQKVFRDLDNGVKENPLRLRLTNHLSSLSFESLLKLLNEIPEWKEYIYDKLIANNFENFDKIFANLKTEENPIAFLHQFILQFHKIEQRNNFQLTEQIITKLFDLNNPNTVKIIENINQNTENESNGSEELKITPASYISKEAIKKAASSLINLNDLPFSEVKQFFLKNSYSFNLIYDVKKESANRLEEIILFPSAYTCKHAKNILSQLLNQKLIPFSQLPKFSLIYNFLMKMTPNEKKLFIKELQKDDHALFNKTIDNLKEQEDIYSELESLYTLIKVAKNGFSTSFVARLCENNFELANYLINKIDLHKNSKELYQTFSHIYGIAFINALANDNFQHQLIGMLKSAFTPIQLKKFFENLPDVKAKETIFRNIKSTYDHKENNDKSKMYGNDSPSLFKESPSVADKQQHKTDEVSLP